jgi:excinuclease UvrABC helicase subunit UvrB
MTYHVTDDKLEAEHVFHVSRLEESEDGGQVNVLIGWRNAAVRMKFAGDKMSAFYQLSKLTPFTWKEIEEKIQVQETKLLTPTEKEQTLLNQISEKTQELKKSKKKSKKQDLLQAEIDQLKQDLGDEQYRKGLKYQADIEGLKRARKYTN